MTRTAADTYRGLRAFTDELVRCGVRFACTSPGSRSTPIVLSLVRDGRLDCTSHIDERSGSFFGLGIAKATGVPAVLACTSGTAAANYAPAVIEAWEARVPLLVLTADRPSELRDVGAGQTIDQVKLYGRAAKCYLEVDDVAMSEERLRWMRALASRAVWTSLEGRPGPVHLNFALREPLVLDSELGPEPDPGRPDGRPWVDRGSVPSPPANGIGEEVGERPRAVVVAGRDERGGGAGVVRFCSSLGLPLLADPLSGARVTGAVAHYDAFLRDAGWAAAHAPDLVIRVGDLPTSKPLRQWLASLEGARQISLDPEGARQDPTNSVDLFLPATLPDAQFAISRLGAGKSQSGWLEEWRAADIAAASALATTLGDDLTEPKVAADLYARLPSQAALVVASSMPIRDLESFAAAREAPPRVLSNRGANGIDGTLSTAFGVAHAHEGPTVLLTGDVAFLHDLGGLIAARRTQTKLVVVILNNDGGGIFHFLPVAKEGEDFERHVATPHGLDLAKASDLFGVAHSRQHDLAGFRTALDQALHAPTSTVIEVRTDRAANRELHARAWQEVARSVRGGA
jgi:2-succinyl-5-enolpyruvyl-6-hydroxy-3-cyclohexene-1-carboxylate synthase